MMPPRDPVRVMHLVTGLNVGGAETALLRLLGRMDRRRVESAVVSMIAPGPIAQQLTAIGIEVTALDMTPGRPMPWALARLVRQLRRSQPDVLQTWMYHADLLGTLAAPLSRVPRLAWNIRGSVNAETRRSRALRAVVALCARLSSRPDVIVANSQEGRRSHIVRGYRADGWSVVPNGIDTSQFHPDPEAREATRRALGLSTDTFVVGLVARYDRLKAHSVFLTAAAAMAAVNPVVRFVLVGEGMSADHPVIGAQVRTLGLTDRVLLLGRREDIPALTRAFDVATLPSLSEGFPNVLIEALASGVPCVATRVGEAPAIVGEAGCIVAPGDASALVSAWQALYSAGPAARALLGAGGRAHVEREYAIERVAERYERLYRQLAGRD